MAYLIIPWKRSEMITLRRQIDDLCDHFFQELSNRFCGPDLVYRWTVKEDDTHIIVKFDLPDIAARDIDVTLSGDVLVVKARGTRTQLLDKSELQSMVCMERRIRLPSAVESDDAEAIYSEGSLTVVLPKSRTKTYRIPVT